MAEICSPSAKQMSTFHVCSKDTPHSDSRPYTLIYPCPLLCFRSSFYLEIHLCNKIHWFQPFLVVYTTPECIYNMRQLQLFITNGLLLALNLQKLRPSSQNLIAQSAVIIRPTRRDLSSRKQITRRSSITLHVLSKISVWSTF